jgi:hypothetical protein
MGASEKLVVPGDRFSASPAALEEGTAQDIV